VAAFRRDRDAADIAFDAHRFSLSQAVASENIFVLVMPGPYDYVAAIEYRKGIPRVAYETATHGDIAIRVNRNRVVLRVVESGPDVKTETKTLTFSTTREDLDP
jgi:hypothetical protein